MCKILLSTILLSLNSKLLEALLPHALSLLKAPVIGSWGTRGRCKVNDKPNVFICFEFQEDQKPLCIIQNWMTDDSAAVHYIINWAQFRGDKKLCSRLSDNGSLHKCLSKHRYEENITKLVCLQEILCPSCWPESMNPVTCFPVVEQDHLPDSQEADSNANKHKNLLHHPGFDPSCKLCNKP